jgi:hypothetical protein
MANMIVADLRRINPRIPIGVLKRVADEAAKTFPDSILSKDQAGKNLSEKPILLLAKMEARRNYLNRKNNKSTHTTQNVSRPITKRREADTLAATVKKYQPNILGVEDELREKQSWLKSERKFVAPDSETVNKYITETYGLQRFNLNNYMPVNTIKE